MIEAVRVTVRLFAGLRERAGTGRLEVDGVDRVGDVWKRLDLGGEPSGLLYALNRAYVERDHALADGDEVALIPPVSGGAFVLSTEPLDVARVVAEAESDDAGAVASFVGTVRRQSRGRDVVRLEYEAFAEMAEPMLRRLAEELTAKHGLCEVAIHHRVGSVDVGEARRQGLHVSWPMFIPFFGAYVTIQRAGLTPFRSGLISLAGPFVGSLGAAAVWAAGSFQGSNKLEVLANIGFLLNAFNLLPIGFLDGGHG